MKSYHMDTESFRKYGHEIIDWIADYRDRIESFPVQSNLCPGDIREALPNSPPLQGEDFETIMSDVDRIILPGITHWQSPNFFAYFPSNASGPSIFGEMLSAGLGVQGMLWATSPACTELESHVLDWLADMLHLPNFFKSCSQGGGVIQDTASSATLCAVLAARERASSFKTNIEGIKQNLVAYTSSHSHSSVTKAIKIAGIGTENLRLIDVDETFAMKASSLAHMIARDQQAGKLPFFVCSTIGTTSSNAIDPLREIGPICEQNNLWLHVDAAMSGTASLCPEFRYINNGLEAADSYCVNPHKWMFTNFDCDCFYIKNRNDLINTLSILPEYLRNKATDSGSVIDYRDWHIPLGRRFRALKLWFVIRHYGIEGLQYHIRRHVELAKQFTHSVQKDRRFELAAPVPLNLVCFRHIGGDDVNKELLNKLNSSGKLYLTHTKLDGHFTLRMSIGQSETEESHVKEAWSQISALAPNVA